MKLIKKHNNKKGFTLVELVIVIAILAVLALILVPAISGYVDKSNTAKNQASARSIYTNAVLVASTTKETEEAKINEEVEKLSNAAAGSVKVVLKDDKTVASITYTPEKGDPVSFDGKTFDDKTETPENEGQ